MSLNELSSTTAEIKHYRRLGSTDAAAQAALASLARTHAAVLATVPVLDRDLAHASAGGLGLHLVPIRPFVATVV